jgi:starch synthase (maltosyl-transferring)
MSTPSRLRSKSERVVIENVAPAVNAGRFPAKRSLGDQLLVAADIYKDGHDVIGARVRFQRPGERSWDESSMRYEYDPDRWHASVELDELGRWRFTVEAWPDPFSTWCIDLKKRLGARQDVASELLEGAAILRSAKISSRAERKRVAELAAVLEDHQRDVDGRVAVALDDELAGLMSGPLSKAWVTRYERELEIIVDRERARFGAWYEMFPRSQTTDPDRHGTFADAARRLPEIADLGFDVVYLPPIHPIGRTHRKGPNNNPEGRPGDLGSPWAIGGPEGGHTAVHPELGTIDDFDRFVDDAKDLGIEVALDFALQCSPDHPWTREHPEWFFQRPDGTIRYAENPPKKYEDIYPLNFWCDDHAKMWQACRDILLYWIDHGVKIFRVDNPHTKPFAFWEWCLRDVQEKHPDTIFLSEAFTRPKRMLGLAKIGFSQSYTYFTWKNLWWELRELMNDLLDPKFAEVYRPNFFANTPDILHEYLQRGGRPAFRARLLLAATLAPSYGIYSGFELCDNVPVREGSEEYLDSEKYQVRVRDWDAAGNIKADIATVNRLRREHPALQRLENLTFLESENREIFWFWKRCAGDDLFVAVNLDPTRTQESTVHVPLSDLGLAGDARYRVRDLLTGEAYDWSGPTGYVRLDPAERAGHVLQIEVDGRGGRS